MDDVQEYLDAIVDEFRTLENESQYNLQENTNIPSDANADSKAPPLLPRISVTKAFNNEMEQYLYGYGENYGQLSSPDLLTDGGLNQSGHDDLHSVEVHTSLNSSQSGLDIGNDKPVDMNLPREVESVYDQVQRFHSSMEQEEKTTHKVSFQCP